jgi:hydrophobic/amphiphilic exporter-1 (mainly G- bacteria), HAE1 family
MPLAKLAIKQPIFITMVLLAIALVGILGYQRMGVELYPNTTSPVVSVSVSFPGASPSDVETLVTKPIEQALSTISGVDSINSSSGLGSSNVMVTFVAGYDQTVGAQQVRESLDTISRRLPSGASAPVMRRFDPSTMPFMTVALNVAGDPSADDLRQLIEQVLIPQVNRVPGVAAASVNGYPTQLIGVDLIASRLQSFGVTPQQITSALVAQNVTTPSGSITNPTANIPIRISAQLKTMEEVGNIVVTTRGTQLVRLSDVANIGPELATVRSYTRVNGKNAMVMEIQSQAGSNVVQVAQDTRDKLKLLSQQYPNVTFMTLSDNSVFIEQSDRDVIYTMIIGAILAALIVFAFIRNVRNTIITVAGLPIIILGTFAVISAMGFTLNIITLMALSLSVGLLIDDAIVVRENIFRHMEHGASPREAAENGTGEIAFAVIAISLTIIAVFIPVAFTTGQIGGMFKEFGITVAVAVVISLFEAFTFAPLLTAFFAKPLAVIEQKVEKLKSRNIFSGFWQKCLNAYRRILGWSLRHRLVVVGITVVLFVPSFWALYRMPLSYFPTTNEGQISISINLPPGNSLETTNGVVKAAEQVVMAQPETQALYTRVNTTSGNVSIQLKPGSDTDVQINRLRSSLSQYSRVMMFSKPSQFMGMGGLGGGGGGGVRSMPVQIVVRGPVDPDTLEACVSQIMTALGTVNGVKDVRESTPAQQTEVHITVNRERCAMAGVSASLVGQQISTLIGGTTATQMEFKGQLTDVVVGLQDQDKSDPAGLLNLPIISSSGTLYTLADLANIQPGTGPTTLSRQNQQRVVTVGANLQGRTLGEAAPDIQKVLDKVSLPAAVTWQFGGQQTQTQNAFASLFFALIIGLIFIYMVLASQFGSFIHPFTVMSSLPLAIIGSAGLMVATHTGLTVISMIGIILMMGLATKNSILLVDFIIRYRKQGRDKFEAVLEAGPVRLRPILMTSLSIMLGMIPTAVAMGSSGTFRAPMAIAVIGGVFSSTLLSLVAVPVVYSIIDDITNFFKRLFHRQPKVRTNRKVEILTTAQEDTHSENQNN